MPLSEQEQRLLDEMERNLYHGDADFVASVGRSSGRAPYTAVVGGILLALAGVAVVVLGVLISVWVVGLLGFAAMFAGALLAIGGPGRRFRAAGRRGLFDRVSGRWAQRRR